MTIAALVRRAAHGLLDLVLPPRCLRCGGRSKATAVCAPSAGGRSPFLARRSAGCAAIRCRTPTGCPLCGDCAAEPPVFDRARAALRIDDGARR